MSRKHEIKAAIRSGEIAPPIVDIEILRAVKDARDQINGAILSITRAKLSAGDRLIITDSCQIEDITADIFETYSRLCKIIKRS